MTQITVKEAVHRAKEALTELYEDDLPRALALEEIELVNDGDVNLWAVTLGFYRSKSVSAIPGGTLDLMGLRTPSPVENRVYKTIFINAETGAFVRMDIRQVQ